MNRRQRRLMEKKQTKSKSVSRMNVEDYSYLFSNRDTDLRQVYNTMKEKTLELVMNYTNRTETPNIYFCDYDVEYWFSNTKNPDTKEVMSVTYNKLKQVYKKRV